ncbi:MAG: DUF4430 domain-containing protein [Candidatus Brocadiales bacterium]
MKHLKRIISVLVLVVLMPTAYPHGAHHNVVVEIDYGGKHPFREIEVEWHQGMTALEALQSVANIETKQINGFILVTSIDGVEWQSGNMAWYYDVNGERAEDFADRCVLSEGDHMRWSFTKDVCSPKMDKEVRK